MAMTYTATDWITAGTPNGAVRWKEVTVTAAAGDLLVAIGFAANFTQSSPARLVETTAGTTSAWTQGEPAVLIGADVDAVGAWATVTTGGSITVRVSLRVQSEHMGAAVIVVPAAEWTGTPTFTTFAADADGQVSVTLSGAGTSSVIYAGSDWSATDPGTADTPAGGTNLDTGVDSGQYSWEIRSWTGQTSGTRNYGPSGLSGVDVSGFVLAFTETSDPLNQVKPDTAGATDAAIPYIDRPQLVGAGTFTSGTGALSIPLPAGALGPQDSDKLKNGDLLIMACESANQAFTTPSGWNAAGELGTGTAAAAGGVRIALFWRWYQAGNVSVADTGDHTTGRIYAIRFVDPDTPINGTAQTRVDSSATTTFTSPSVTIPTNGMALHFVAIDRDAATTDTELNALTGCTLIGSNTVTSGFGGGVGAAYSYTAGQVTVAGGFDTSLAHAYASIALNPISLAGGALTQTPADSAGATDSAAVVQSLVRGPADSAGATDSATASLTSGYTPSAADSAGATDAVQISRSVTAADSAGVTDTGAPQQLAITYTVDDPAGATDAASRVSAMARTAADTAGATDSATVDLSTTQIDRTPADTAGATDAATPTMSAQRSVADSAAGSDAASTVASLDRATADAAGATDGATAVASLDRPASDSASGADAASSVLSAARGPADAASGADSATAQQDLARTAADSAAGADAASTAVTFTRTAADTAGGSDAAAGVQQLARTAADQADATDQATYSLTTSGSANVNDVAGASDAVTTVADVARSAADAASGADATALARGAAPGDAAGATDAAQRVSALDRSAGDPASGSDAATLARSAGPADAGAGSDAVTATIGRQRAADDTADAADDASAVLDAARAIVDAAQVFDEVVVELLVGRAVSDQATISDEVQAILTSHGVWPGVQEMRVGDLNVVEVRLGDERIW